MNNSIPLALSVSKKQSLFLWDAIYQAIISIFQEAEQYPLTEDIWVDVTDEIKQQQEQFNLKPCENHGHFNTMSHAESSLLGTLENLEKREFVSEKGMQKKLDATSVVSILVAATVVV